MKLFPPTTLRHVSHLSLKKTDYGYKILKPPMVSRSGVIDRIPVFWHGNPDSIPGGDRDLNLYPFICILSCVASGGGPDILLSTDFRKACPGVSV